MGVPEFLAFFRGGWRVLWRLRWIYGWVTAGRRPAVNALLGAAGGELRPAGTPARARKAVKSTGDAQVWGAACGHDPTL